MKLDMNCRDTARLVTQSLDSGIGPLNRYKIWRHNKVCPLCSRYANQLRWLDIVLKQRSRQEASEALGESGVERIVQGLIHNHEP